MFVCLHVFRLYKLIWFLYHYLVFHGEKGKKPNKPVVTETTCASVCLRGITLLT